MPEETDERVKPAGAASAAQAAGAADSAGTASEGEAASVDEAGLAVAVSRVVEALRPVLEDLADDPSD